MARHFGLIFAWVLATAVATLISMAAVSLVGASVVDQPIAQFIQTTTTTNTTGTTSVPESLASTTTSPTIEPTLGSTTTTLAVPTTSGATTTTTQPSPTTTTSPATTSTTVAPTTTTVPDTTTTTVATTGPFTFPVNGGSVTISCSGNTISLGGAVPDLGFAVEVEKSGPDEVRVEFTAGETEVEVRIECLDGVPAIELDD